MTERFGVSGCCGASRQSGIRSNEREPERDLPAGGGKSGERAEVSMIALPGGSFRMGTDDGEGMPADGEGPSRIVSVDAFSISARAITNRDFAAFADETSYVTEAEAYGWSYVFHLLASDAVKRQFPPRPGHVPWWLAVPGASWRKPEGPDSGLEGREDHPAVHISWHDAQAYCVWSGTQLPTEAQWEYAARGGLDGRKYPWGDELNPGGVHRCNIWQGEFPLRNAAEDGYIGTAPADAFEPNGYGLYNMAGNVWEWCLDSFTPDYHRITDSSNPLYAKPAQRKAMRGGSYLCHHSYCNRYRVAARTGNTPDSSAGNCGFRVVSRGAAAQ